MFKSLKDKLSGFFKKHSEENEKEELEEITVEKTEEEPKKDKESKKEKVEEKPEEDKEEEIKEEDPEDKKEKEKEVEEPKEEKTEEKVEEKKELKEKPLEEENKEELEHAIEEVEESLPITENKGFFQKITGKINSVKLSQEKFNEFFEQLENILLENNVSLEVADKIKDDMEKKLVNIEIKKNDIEKEIKDSLKESLDEILLEPFDIIDKIKEKEEPFVILFFGVNGAGKTTSIAKVANLLQTNKIPCVIAAGDTFRAASIEQLQTHGDKLGIKVIKQDYGADPAAVAFDAVKHAKSQGIKAVLIDTAGRMHTKDNLLKEMEKIIRVIKPDLKIFVAESITGNDATQQAKTFDENFEIDGSILTKADVDEKPGCIISVGYITKKPILFLGVGQKYKDLEKFSKKEILTHLGLD